MTRSERWGLALFIVGAVAFHRGGWWMRGRWPSVALVVLGLLGFACPRVRAQDVPMIKRPDTRSFVGITIDSAVIRATLDEFSAHFPHESSVCLHGEIKQELQLTLAGRVPVRVATVDRVQPGVGIRADSFQVWFTDELFGCPDGRGLLGRAHPHFWTPPDRPCAVSDNDAQNLASDRRALFSIVFCTDGRAELLWQDGRRWALVWGTPMVPGGSP